MHGLGSLLICTAVSRNGQLPQLTLYLQSIDGARGVFQQQMQGLKAEGTQLREALHDVQWAASQASGPNQAAVSISTPLLVLAQLVAMHHRLVDDTVNHRH